MRKKSSIKVKSPTDFSAVFIILGGICLWLLWPGADKYAEKSPDASLRGARIHYITDYESKAYLKPDMFAMGGFVRPMLRDEDELLVPVELDSVKKNFALPPPELPPPSALLPPVSFEKLFGVPDVASRTFLPPLRSFKHPGNDSFKLHVEPGRKLRGYGYEVLDPLFPEEMSGRVWQVRASVEFDETGNVEAVFIDAPHSDAAINRYVEKLLRKSRLREKPAQRVGGRVIVATVARRGVNTEKQGADNADQGM